MDKSKIEMVIIEKSVLEELTNRIKHLNTMMEQVYIHNGLKTPPEWMNNREVCNILRISKQTLQGYRDRGKLPFTQVGAKMYYKPADIESLLSSGYSINCTKIE